MKIIPRNIHGILDYLVGVLLIAAPWVLGFADNGPASYVPVILGAGALVYSLLTNYEMGLMRIIPFGHPSGLGRAFWRTSSPFALALRICGSGLLAASDRRPFRNCDRPDDAQCSGLQRRQTRAHRQVKLTADR